MKSMLVVALSLLMAGAGCSDSNSPAGPGRREGGGAAPPAAAADAAANARAPAPESGPVASPVPEPAAPEAGPARGEAPGASVLPVTPADATSSTWPYVKQETLPEFDGATAPRRSAFVKLYFNNSGALLRMSFRDQDGAPLRLLQTETTPQFASAIVLVGPATKAIRYKLSR